FELPVIVVDVVAPKRVSLIQVSKRTASTVIALGWLVGCYSGPQASCDGPGLSLWRWEVARPSGYR
ncbi:MAG: hypothetical protein ACI9OJ_001882, partial [Myxococcota bacterium]